MFIAQSIFAKNVALLIQFILAQGYFISFSEAWRPQVTANYYAGKHIGISHSLHCERLAIDLNLHDASGKYLTDKKHYQAAGAYWESLDKKNLWGGHFTSGTIGDFDHFERHP
jgi:hypothetical protein